MDVLRSLHKEWTLELFGLERRYVFRIMKRTITRGSAWKSYVFRRFEEKKRRTSRYPLKIQPKPENWAWPKIETLKMDALGHETKADFNHFDTKLLLRNFVRLNFPIDKVEVWIGGRRGRGGGELLQESLQSRLRSLKIPLFVLVKVNIVSSIRHFPSLAATQCRRARQVSAFFFSLFSTQKLYGTKFSYHF